MVRSRYATSGGDVAVSVNTTTGALSMPTATPTPFPVYDAFTGGNQITDLTNAAGDPITAAPAPTAANPQASFFGPDGYTGKLYIQDAAGRRWRIDPDTAPTGTGTVDETNLVHKSGNETIAGTKTFSSAPTVPDGSFTPAKTTGFDTQARTAVGLTTGQTAPSLQGDNTFAGTNTFPAASIDSSALAGLDSRFDNYVATKGIPQFKTFPNATTPAVAIGLPVLWGELGAGVTGTPTATLVTHNATGTDQATYTFPPDSTMPAASLYIAFVGTGTTVVGGTAVIASSVTGRGLTWTKIGAGTVAGNNATSLVAFRASGTPTASGDFSVTFPSATEACHLEVVAVNNVSSTVTASAYGTASANLSTPTVTHAPTTINSAHFQLLALQVNTATGSTTADPGTPLGTTPDVTSTGPTLTSRVSYKTSAAQAVTWTRSAAAQYAAASIVLTPA